MGDVASDPLVGRVLGGKFRILSLLARGGMGAVYRAEQAPLGRICALKILRPPEVDGGKADFQRRFFLEASIASRLTHPNTVTIFDYGRADDDTYFLAMEYLEGRTLFATLKQEGPLGETRALRIAKQVCRALREAHAMGVVHRDVKPANIFLTKQDEEDDFVKVLDFGLVKEVEQNGGEDLTQAGTFLGSPKYMSPEQIKGDAIDARTDVYSLGCVLFEMLAGKAPFDRGSTMNTLIAHVNEPAPALRDVNPECDASAATEAIVQKCLAKAKEARFASMEDLLAALKSLDAPGSDLATTGSGPHVPMVATSGAQVVSMAAAPIAAPRRSKLPIAAGALAVAAAAAIGIFVGSRETSTSANARRVDAGSSVESAPPAAASPSVVATPSAPAAPSAPKPRVVHVTSEPAGATVRIGDENGRRACERTPCDVTLEDGETHLHVAKPGFVAITKLVEDGERDVDAKLRAIVVAPRHETTTSDDRYKHDPYGLPPY